MKKSILTAMALSLSAFGVYSQTLQADNESLLFGYCGDYASSVGTTDSSVTSESAAIEIPEELALSWKGAVISKVSIGYGVSWEDKITIFLTKSLNGEPFYTQEASITQKNGWNDFELDQPYILDGEGFFVGYTASVINTVDKPIGVDGILTSEKYGDWINNYDAWEHVGRYYGSVCIRLYMQGDMLPQHDVEALGVSVPEIVTVDAPFTATLSFVNHGLKTVETLDLECSIDGIPVENIEVRMPENGIPSGEIGTVELTGLQYETTGKDVPLEVKILNVNGYEDETPLDNVASGEFTCVYRAFRKNVVVEEFTGTWCGWCPVGIVAMQYMRQTYGNEGFIGIAIHSSDEMTVPEFQPVISRYATGSYPVSSMDRTLTLYPSSEILENNFLKLRAVPSLAKVELEAEYDIDTKTIKVDATSIFTLAEEDASYALAFVVIEDNMGPYVQNNSYSGSSIAYLDGWNQKPSMVSMLFNEVGRNIVEPMGIENSLPSEIESLKEYYYSTSLPLTNIVNLSECEAIVYLIDTSTGEIVNAAKSEIKNAVTGIDNIQVESDGLIRVYNTQGVKVMQTKNISDLQNLAKGIYIVNGKKIRVI